MSMRVQQDNVYFAETTTNLGSSATFTGAARSVGAASGEQHRYVRFNVTATAGVAGNVRIEMSQDGTAWLPAVVNTAVAANGATTISTPITARFYRAVYANGATAQTGAAFMVNSSFTVA